MKFEIEIETHINLGPVLKSSGVEGILMDMVIQRGYVTLSRLQLIAMIA